MFCNNTKKNGDWVRGAHEFGNPWVEGKERVVQWDDYDPLLTYDLGSLSVLGLQFQEISVYFLILILIFIVKLTILCF